MRSIGLRTHEGLKTDFIERWTNCISSRAAASHREAREIDVERLGAPALSIPTGPSAIDAAKPKPQSPSFNGHCGLAKTRSLVRIFFRD